MHKFKGDWFEFLAQDDTIVMLGHSNIFGISKSGEIYCAVRGEIRKNPKIQLAQDLLNDTLDPDTEMKLKLMGVLK